MMPRMEKRGLVTLTTAQMNNTSLCCYFFILAILPCWFTWTVVMCLPSVGLYSPKYMHAKYDKWDRIYSNYSKVVNVHEYHVGLLDDKITHT